MQYLKLSQQVRQRFKAHSLSRLAKSLVWQLGEWDTEMSYITSSHLPWFCVVQWTLRRHWHSWHSCLSVPPCSPSSMSRCSCSPPPSSCSSCVSLCRQMSISGIRRKTTSDYWRGLPLIYHRELFRCPPFVTFWVAALSAHLSRQTPSQTCARPALPCWARPSGASVSWECSPHSHMFHLDLFTTAGHINTTWIWSLTNQIRFK